MKISSFLRGTPIFHNGSLEEGVYSLKINIPKALSKISTPVNFQAFLRLRISILSEIGEIETLEDENIQIYDQPLRVNFHPLSRSNFKSPIPFSLFLTVLQLSSKKFNKIFVPKMRNLVSGHTLYHQISLYNSESLIKLLLMT